MDINFAMGLVNFDVVNIISTPGFQFSIELLKFDGSEDKSLLKSNPAQNEEPLPRSTIILTESSWFALVIECCNSDGVNGEIVFNLLGRLKVINANGEETW